MCPRLTKAKPVYGYIASTIATTTVAGNLPFGAFGNADGASAGDDKAHAGTTGTESA